MPKGVWKNRPRITGPDHHMFVHGHSPKTNGHQELSPAYRSWRLMMRRCHVEIDQGYRAYGAVGIRVCERWHTFLNFLEDMGARPPGTSIDRIDNARGYEPGNCRWADHVVQGRNRRNVKLNMDAAAEIRRRRASGEILRTIAADFGISTSTTHDVASGRIWQST